MLERKPWKIPAALLARYQAGEIYIRELAKLLGVTTKSVDAELGRLGVDTSRATRRALTAARRKGYKDHAELHGKARELYAAGKSLRQVARELGLSSEGVRLILLRHGVALRPPKGKP